jgi:hypothetical protein
MDKNKKVLQKSRTFLFTTYDKLFKSLFEIWISVAVVSTSVITVPGVTIVSVLISVITIISSA